MISKTLKCMKNNIFNTWSKSLVELKEDQKLNMTSIIKNNKDLKLVENKKK
jgi:hypothetical protein